MIPQEWPITASVAERKVSGRAAMRGRLRSVRLDFFLDPAERLTEQERALMSAMLHCLVGDIAAELRAALPAGWIGANDEDIALVEILMRAGLLDDCELMALLLRRADEERIASAARARCGRGDTRALQGMVSHSNGDVAAAAMALILVRGRRRDRFGQCLVGFDDLSCATADRLVHSIAAVLRSDAASRHGVAAGDAELTAASRELLANRQPSRSVEALSRELVTRLDEAEGLTDQFLLACVEDGEILFLGEVLGRRAGISDDVALDELLSSNPEQVMMVMRVAGFSRDLCAGLLATIGDLLGIDDPGEAISLFDNIGSEEVKAAAAWLATAPSYRAALEALSSANG